VNALCRMGIPRGEGASASTIPLGFTLVELLVVVAIIAILMAITVPTLSRVRRQARGVVCQANLRQWGMTLSMYAQNNDGHLPSRGIPEIWLLRGAFLLEDPNAPQDSLHQFHTRDIALCPMANKPARFGRFVGTRTRDGQTMSFEGTAGSTFGAWELTVPTPVFHASYGFNGFVFSGLSTEQRSLADVLGEVDVLALKGAARIPVLVDAVEFSLRTAVLEDGGSPPWHEFERSEGGRPGAGPMAHFCCINRHNEAVNGLFLDWSVRRIGLKELWTLKWYREYDTSGRWTRAGGVKPEDWPKWMRRLKDY